MLLTQMVHPEPVHQSRLPGHHCSISAQLLLDFVQLNICIYAYIKKSKKTPQAPNLMISLELGIFIYKIYICISVF